MARYFSRAAITTARSRVRSFTIRSQETGDLHTARFLHTATLLSDGRVLVAGGYNGDAVSSAELYDPATGNWTDTGSFKAPGGLRHTATLLPDGQVLVAGGQEILFGGTFDTAELYNPATGEWSPALSTWEKWGQLQNLAVNQSEADQCKKAEAGL